MSTIAELVSEQVKITDGWTEESRCIEMAQLILDHRPRIVVEIGVFGGRTLISQGLAMKEANCGRVYGLDPWRTQDAVEDENKDNAEWWSKVDMEEFHRKTMGHIWRLGLDEWVSVIRSPAQFVASLFHDGDIGIIYIDGNHSEKASCRDVNLWLPKVVSGGHVWFDDAGWPSTQAALRLLDDACEKVKDGGHYRLYRKR